MGNSDKVVNKMYRIYDNYEHQWVRDGVYLSPYNDMYTSKKTMFGAEKLSLASEQRYTLQQDIGLYDVNRKLIFEGDICRAKDKNVIGVIAYSSENASYYLFDNNDYKYYVLNEVRCKQMEVIGNVFDNKSILSTEETDQKQESVMNDGASEDLS